MIVKCNQANKIRIGNSILKLKCKLKVMVFLVQEKFWKEFYFTFYCYLKLIKQYCTPKKSFNVSLFMMIYFQQKVLFNGKLKRTKKVIGHGLSTQISLHFNSNFKTTWYMYILRVITILF